MRAECCFWVVRFLGDIVTERVRLGLSASRLGRVTERRVTVAYITRSVTCDGARRDV